MAGAELQLTRGTSLVVRIPVEFILLCAAISNTVRQLSRSDWHGNWRLAIPDWKFLMAKL
jgi:hypothetical protein